jgi:hypothetical protein
MHNVRDFSIEQFDAIEQSDGSYLNKNGTIHWFNEAGQNHRDDGPSIIKSDGKIYWYIKGYVYSFTRWLPESNASDETKMMLRLQYA